MIPATTMPRPSLKFRQQYAKIITAACVRRGYLEKLHKGPTPVTKTGDYSDVKVVDADGKEIPWNKVARINQDEMKALMQGVVDRVFTFMERTSFSKDDDTEFREALDRSPVAWVKNWDEPKYLPDFLMPVEGKEE